MASQPQEITPNIPFELPEPQTQLVMSRAPRIVLEEAQKAAAALQQLIEAKPNKVVLNGKTFLQFEDWQTLGSFFGVTPAARSTNYIEYGRVQGFECHAEAILVSSGQVISAAQAMCLDDEKNWNTRGVYEYSNGRRIRTGEEKVPLFQLRSMAQTRAQAKALRNVFAWVVVLAGYQPTPAEEMDAVAGGASSNGNSGPIADRVAYKPLHPDLVRKLCFEIANSASMPELKARYLAAGKQAKKANDRAALDAFIAAKDERKRKLAKGGVQ